MHYPCPRSFLPEANELEGGREAVFVGTWLLGVYILLLRWESLLISSVTFLVPSQLRRGMGKTLVYTEENKMRAGRNENMGK